MNAKNAKSKFKVIYSLKIRVALREKGFEPVFEMDNIYEPGFKCWQYLNTPEFSKTLDEIMEKGGSRNG